MGKRKLNVTFPVIKNDVSVCLYKGNGLCHNANIIRHILPVMQWRCTVSADTAIKSYRITLCEHAVIDCHCAATSIERIFVLSTCDQAFPKPLQGFWKFTTRGCDIYNWSLICKINVTRHANNPCICSAEESRVLVCQIWRRSNVPFPRWMTR